MPTEFKVTGFKEMASILTGKTRNVHSATSEALRMEALSVLAVAKERYVPVDSGTLKDSGQVHEVQFNAITGGMSVTISFGSGPSKPYAEAVHEYSSRFDPPSWRNAHNPPVHFSPDGHGPQFSNIPLEAAQQTLRSRVAMRVRLAMG